MRRSLYAGRVLTALIPFLTAGADVQAALANRVFVAAKSGNDLNGCASVATPCQTFAGAYSQVAAGGEIIVLESGGYGPVTITGAVTIDAPAGVTAFIHPPSGDAITVNAGSSDVVTVRGLVLNGGTNNGITANSVGTLNVVNCFITAFASYGIEMISAGNLNVKGSDVTGCDWGIGIVRSTGILMASIDHCHLDGNHTGFLSSTTSPGGSFTTATNSTANNNVAGGWTCGIGFSGSDGLNLEFCMGSGNGASGLFSNSPNANSFSRYSNCVFANNGSFGVVRFSTSPVASRGNSTITGNGSGPTSGTISPFSGM